MQVEAVEVELRQQEEIQVQVVEDRRIWFSKFNFWFIQYYLCRWRWRWWMEIQPLVEQEDQVEEELEV
jgi:hypothetical protein